MKFRLTDDASARVRYSPTEKIIFNLIPAHPRRISSREIVDLLDRDDFHALSSVSVALRSLVEKAEHNDEPFRIKKSDRAGPHPTEYWLEKA